MTRSHFASAVSFYGTFAVVLLLIAVVAFIDVRLARTDAAQREQESESYFREGQAFAARGEYDQAVDRFRTAVSMQREDLGYQVALANSLLAADRISEARTEANRLLDAEPTSADAALILARILAGEGQVKEATSYYHRAIFGTWQADDAKRELDTRLELAGLLAKNGSTEELLAELLPLQDQAAGDLDLKRRIASLYLTAGSPDRSATLYEEILEASPEDSAAYAGLAEAEFARGNYQTALRNFDLALSHDPPDAAALRARRDLTDQVLQLDPMARRLSSAQRYQRSLTLLRMALNSMNACTGPNQDLLAFTLAQRADEALARTVTAGQRNDAVDQNLDLAEQIWSLRQLACGAALDPAGQSVNLVLSRMAQ